MPYIQTRVSVPISAEAGARIQSRLGESISIFPGKSENFLMVELKDNCRLFFRGNQDEATAMVKVELFGTPDKNACEKFTAVVCQLLSEELAIPEDRIFINYQEYTLWGWNGSNF